MSIGGDGGSDSESGGDSQNPAASSSSGSSGNGNGSDGSSISIIDGEAPSADDSGAPSATKDATTSIDVGPTAPVFGDECLAGTVYEDDFTFNPAGRWQTAAATWSWDQANKIYTVTGFNPHGVTWIGPRPKWRDYVVDASIRVSGPVGGTHGNAGPYFRVGDVGPNNSDGHEYLAAVVLGGDDDVIFGTEAAGTYVQRDQTSDITIPQNQWIAMRVEVKGQGVKIYVNGTKAIDTTSNMFATGSVGFKSYRLNFSVRSIKVTCG